VTAPRALAPPPLPLRAGLWCASQALRLLGRARYGLADVIGLGFYAVSPAARRRCADNHRRLEPGIDGAEARRRARRSFTEYMRTSLDFVWAYGVPIGAMDRHARSQGVEHLWNALEEHGGAVAALAHYGSWDIAASCVLASGMPLTAVMSPVGNSMVTRIAAWTRRKEMELLLTGNARQGLVEAVSGGRVVCILCDLPERGATEVDIHRGAPVPFSTAPAWLSRSTGAPIICAECWRNEHGYQLVIHPPLFVGDGETDVQVTQRMADTLEPAIRRDPSQWYPFRAIYSG
jgi:lauroyl/myristoyl acyltransferase